MLPSVMHVEMSIRRRGPILVMTSSGSFTIFLSTCSGRAIAEDNMKTKCLKSGAIAIALSVLAMSSHASVDWDEGFEYADNAAFISRYDSRCTATSMVGTMEISSARVHAGAKSIRMIYPPPDSEGGCNFNRNLTAPSNTIYSRFWIFLDNFTPHPVGTKITSQGPYGLYPSVWWNIMSNNAWNAVVQGIILDNGTRDSVNIYGGTIPANTWACIETQLTMSDPGVDNGIVRAWLNGAATPMMNKTNQRMRAATLNQSNSPSAQFVVTSFYRQHGVGTIYYDDYAVSRDARIGCGSTPPPPTDTQAPTVPAGLGASAASSSQINLTWNVSVDNVGVAGYKIFRAGAQIGTSVGTSYSNTGLTASTAYSYTVAAYDAAGNNSGQSSAASATTQATMPPVGAVGTVSNLSAAATGANGATLSFTEVTDGNGQPAKYDIRFSSVGALWGGAPSVTQGTCASPLAGTLVGATKTCTVLGLLPSTDYQFQLASFRGTMNVDAVFAASPSNVASARTSTAANTMPPAKPKNLRAQ